MRRDADTLVRLYRRGRLWWAGRREAGQRRRVPLRTPHVADARLKAAEIEKRLRRLDAGLVDPTAEHAGKPLAEHVEAFRATLEARNGTAKHVRLTLNYVQEGIAAMGAKRTADSTSPLRRGD